MSAIVQYFEHSLVLPFFGIWMKTDLFQSCGHCWVFQIFWHINATGVIKKCIPQWQKHVLAVVVPILINKDVVEPSYNYLKFRVQNHNYFCTNLIVDCYYTFIYFFKHKVFWFFKNVYNSSFQNCFWKVISETSHRLFLSYAFSPLYWSCLPVSFHIYQFHSQTGQFW